jgi:hypothetical protein
LPRDFAPMRRTELGLSRSPNTPPFTVFLRVAASRHVVGTTDLVAPCEKKSYQNSESSAIEIGRILWEFSLLLLEVFSGRSSRLHFPLFQFTRHHENATRSMRPTPGGGVQAELLRKTGSLCRELPAHPGEVAGSAGRRLRGRTPLVLIRNPVWRGLVRGICPGWMARGRCYTACQGKPQGIRSFSEVTGCGPDGVYVSRSSLRAVHASAAP